MSSILGGSVHPAIYGGTFNTITAYQSTKTRTNGFQRLIDAVSPNAFYDSDNRADPPKCHPNTRVAVINKITDWATGMNDTNALILWLYGPAGTGKTAIARKVAELFAVDHFLLASFLFFRSDANRNTMKPVGANIAYCVSCVIPAAHNLIEATMEADPLILTYSVEVQLTKLVFEPLRLLTDNGYFSNTQFPQLVVIDGLDECLDKGAQTNLIQFLASSMPRYQLPLKFLIVSRPEAHIKSAITLASDQLTILHMELNNDFLPDQDIRRFLTDKFREIKKCHPFRSGIPHLWPSEQQMNTIISKASGQFIYASLAVRFINSACNSPMRQLDIVLELRPPINNHLPFAELDTLYMFILSCTTQLDLVLHILGVNEALQFGGGDNYVTTIETVLGLEGGDIRIYLSPLNSLLEIREYRHDHNIVFYHSSFMDFLRTPERSTDYFIARPKCHALITQSMLQIFTSNSSGPRFKPWFECYHFTSHMEKSLWTSELQRAFERFSMSTYLNWHDYHCKGRRPNIWDAEFPDRLLTYLKDQGTSDLYHRHSRGYLEYATSSMDNPPGREKFRLMSIVWFVLQKPFASLQRGFKVANWKKLCGTLFGLDRREIGWDDKNESVRPGMGDGYRMLSHPTEYAQRRHDCNMDKKAVYGDLAETKRSVPEPILSHRLAHVAISCMRYLLGQDPDTPATWNHLRAWATQSKRSPWLRRQQMRVTSIRHRQPTGDRDEPKYSFPQSLRRSTQILYSSVFKSQGCYQEQHIFYMWTLDLLYHTLLKAMKSDELIKALSKPFIFPVAHVLFPRRIRRVRAAVDAYLEKFGPPRYNTPSVEKGAHIGKLLPQNIAIPFHGGEAESSNKVFLTGRDSVEKCLKRNIDELLDAIYGPTGAYPETVATVNALFDQVKDVGAEIGRSKRRRTTDI